MSSVTVGMAVDQSLKSQWYLAVDTTWNQAGHNWHNHEACLLIPSLFVIPKNVNFLSNNFNVVSLDLESF